MAVKRGGRDLFYARSSGFKTLLRDATETERTVSGDVRLALESVSDSVRKAYRKFAPVESGRMADSIYAKVYTYPGGGVQLRLAVEETVDPVTGYDYFQQSREGRGPITSRGRRMVLSLGRSKAGVPSARYPAGPQDVPPGVPFGFRTVAGFRPEVDWVEAGERNSRRHITRAQRAAGEAIGRHGVMRSYGPR